MVVAVLSFFGEAHPTVRLFLALFLVIGGVWSWLSRDRIEAWMYHRMTRHQGLVKSVDNQSPLIQIQMRGAEIIPRWFVRCCSVAFALYGVYFAVCTMLDQKCYGLLTVVDEFLLS